VENQSKSIKHTHTHGARTHQQASAELSEWGLI